MKVIGLTGGIASGKSTVSRWFRQAGIPVIDADQVARQLVEPNTKGLNQLVNEFGKDILMDNRFLNREKLGEMMFEDSQKRQRVNEILQPLIRQAIETEIQDSSKRQESLLILDIPLLYEMNYHSLCDAVIVVYVTPMLQLERLIERNHFTKKEALQRIHAQQSLEEKRSKADIVFDNTKNLDFLYAQVIQWLDDMKNDIL